MSNTDGKPPFLGRFLDVVGTTNRNVRVAFVYTALVFLSNGLLLQGTLALYIDVLTRSKTKVGYAEGVFGFLSLAPGFVGGYLADKGRRDRIVYVGSVGELLGTVSLVSLCSAYLYAPHAREFLDPINYYDMSGSNETEEEGLAVNMVDGIGSYMFFFTTLCIGLIMMSQSFSYAGYGALQADSLPTGKRTTILAKLQTVRNVTSGIGPLGATLIFYFRDDAWSSYNMAWVILCGAVLRLPATCILFLFNDDNTLQNESKAVTEAPTNSTKSTVWARRVPYLLVSFRTFAALGSGMSVKFFTLFFKDTPENGGLDCNPSVVYFVIAVLPFLRASAVRVSRRFVFIGRVQLLLVQWLMGISALAALVVMGEVGGGFRGMGVRVAALVLYLFRCSALQSGQYLCASIMNDYTPKAQRARWAATMQIQQVGWSGSAALGGLIVEHLGYLSVFTITTAVHVTSLFALAPLLWIVPREECVISEKRDNKNTQEEESSEEDEEVPGGAERVRLLG